MWLAVDIAKPYREVTVPSRFVSAVRRGGTEVLRVCTRERPLELPPGHALVQVIAAGVSYGDVLLRAGVIPGGPRPPFTPGFEVAGTVEKIGDGVTGLRPGQTVVALLRSGGYADYLSVPADRLVPVPARVDPLDAAAAALNYFIATQMLHRVAGVSRGDHVLVHGAAGGVGIAFSQLGRLAGVVTHGTASAAKHDLVRDQGGWPIDYHTENFVQVVRKRTGGQGVSAVFDPIGGGHFRASYRALRRGGHMIGYGQSAAFRDGQARLRTGAWGMLGGIVAPKLIPDRRSTTFYNAWALEKSSPHAYAEDLGTVMRLLADHRIQPVIAETIPLAKAARAHELLERAAVRGKLVLTCAGY
ncbi:MAG TPA: medium chain dehydrogenase/reductase family protein [Streptosporangiaceae bacterium]|jgi:NADPH:quinone reductase-like Zn-dependent oxidoreductase